MTDIAEYASRAVESPIAPPPPMATLVVRARARHRTRIHAFAALGCAALVVLGIATVAVASRNDRDTSSGIAAPRDTRPENRVLTTNGLIEQLTAAGAQVTPDGTEGTAPGSPLAAAAQLLCVNGTQIRVYEYDSAASRAAVSDTISADGSRVGNTASPSSVTVVEWIGPPHFYAAGDIIALVLQDDAPLLQTLTHILGPTISPEAVSNRDARAPCATPPR